MVLVRVLSDCCHVGRPKATRDTANIRNARSRISSEYFLVIEFHPCLKNGTKVRPIQRAWCGPTGRPMVPRVSRGSGADIAPMRVARRYSMMGA